MKITFQNPTQGPLITVSLDDDMASATQAFSVIGASRVPAAAANGLATLRTAAQFAETAPGITGGGIAGPAILIGMLFAAGDSSPRKLATDETIQNPMTPAQLRCLADPYDTSAECAAVRSVTTLFPFSESHLDNPNAARASAANATTSQQLTPTPLDLPTPATPLETQSFTDALLTHIDITKGQAHSIPLRTEEEDKLVTLAQKVASGAASAFDLGLLVWEILEGDLLRPMEFQGFAIDLLDTPVGPIYIIRPMGPDIIRGPLYKELKAIQNAYERVLPDFKNRLMSWPTLLLPSSVYLLGLLPFLREKIRFMVGDLSADDFHNHHLKDLSPAQIILGRSIWLGDLGYNIHGLGVLLHDIWHAIMWEGQKPEVKVTALALYPAIQAVIQNYPEHIRQALNELIETLAQPPMGMTASAAEFVDECLKNLHKASQSPSYKDMSWQDRDTTSQLVEQLEMLIRATSPARRP